MMEEHQDELNEASYQLMMDIYTRQMGDVSPPSRWWRRLGIVLAVLGGITGLLLATGNYPHNMVDLRNLPVPTARVPVSQPQAMVFQERANLLAPQALPQQEMRQTDTPEEESRAAVIPPSSASKDGLSPSGLSTSPTKSPRLKASNGGGNLGRKPKRGCNCPLKDRPESIARQRSIHLSLGSIASEFDPNADLVRSTP